VWPNSVLTANCIPNESYLPDTTIFCKMRPLLSGSRISASYDNLLVLCAALRKHTSLDHLKCWPLSVRFPARVWYSDNQVSSISHTCFTGSCTFSSGTAKELIVLLTSASVACPESLSYRRTAAPLEWRLCLSKRISEDAKERMNPSRTIIEILPKSTITEQLQPFSHQS
jgi:hypothetical protein